ncbi:MAG: hypothetical protein IJA89_04280 [Clostridia bacterium]|nr:hypothetical protein [Clostridia bacterium]
MKEKMIKKVSLTALSALFAVSLSMGVATLIDTTASTADDATVFSGGASVRVQYDEDAQTTDGKNGIRFATYMKGVNLSDIAGSETLVIPKDMLADGADLTDETDGVQVVDTSAKWHTYTDKTEGEVLCAYAVLYDVPEASYSRDMVFETTVYFNDGSSISMDYKTDEKATRSLYQVAELAQAGDEYAAFSTGKKAIVDGYHTKAADGTYVTYDNAVVLSAETATATVNETAAFWTNYYKAYNTVSLNITVTGDVADVTELNFTPDGGEAVEIPRNLLTADEEVSVPVDFAYGDFMKGTFAATVANDTTVSIEIANPTTVATQKTNAMYAYSREDKEMRLGFVNMLKNDEVTADEVLSVKYDGAYVDFTADTTGNNIVFASDILADVEDGDTGASFEIRTANKKYTMTKPIAHTKVFYEADDLFVTGMSAALSKETSYSYFDMSSTTGSRFPNFNTTYTTVHAGGIYALGADIDLTEDTRVLWHTSPDQELGKYDTLQSTTAGLTGTFEGYSHTITGMTVGAGGLFGHVGRGTVRNVAFKDVRYATNKSTNAEQAMYKTSSILAYYIAGYTNTKGVTSTGHFDNVYISVKSAANYYFDSTEKPSNTQKRFTNNSILAFASSPKATYNSMVVDLSALGDINVIGRGMFASQDNTADVFANMNDVYFVSTAPLVATYKDGTTTDYTTVIVDTYNQNNVWTNEDEFMFLYAATMIPVATTDVTYLSNAEQTLYRFNTAEDMEKYFTENEVDTSGFTASGWDTWVPFLGAE